MAKMSDRIANDGKSAYEIAVDNGFVGTEEQWEESLNGNTIITGSVDPTTEGRDGDYYINDSTMYIFGPKALGTWPSGTPIIADTTTLSTKTITLGSTVADLTIDSSMLDTFQKISNSVILNNQTEGFNLNIFNDSTSTSLVDSTTNSITIENTIPSANIIAGGIVSIIYTGTNTVLVVGDLEV